MTITVGILTMSDKGYAGDREDVSGMEIRRIVQDGGLGNVEFYEVIPDEAGIIRDKLCEMVDVHHLDVIFTTGGTGVSPRDVTPEATMAAIDKELPGFSEAMRAESLKKTPHAMISRAVCGIRKESLVINLPGSPKAVRESLAVILPAVRHTVEKIKGSMTECGTS